MKTDDVSKVEGLIIEDQSVFLHGGKWSLADQGSLEDALDAYLPFRNITYKAQLATRSNELDQTLDEIVKRSKDAFTEDVKYGKKPPIKKPSLEDIIPMIPYVGYERNVTLGLEKDAKGNIRAGVRVLYVKDGENRKFLLPLSECSNVAPQIVKAAEATAEFLTQQKFDVHGLKFSMNEIGEIIMSLVLVIDSDVVPNVDDEMVNGEKVENMIFFMPGGFKRQLREFFFKTSITGQIKDHLEKYTPALKKFVEDNRARLAVVGVYITWLDAKSPSELKPTVRPWYHVAGNESVTQTMNSVKLDLFPHLEHIHPSRTQNIEAIVKTVVDGLSLQTRSSLVLLLSEFYFVQCLISQKYKKTAVMAGMQKPLETYLKEKSKDGIIFVSLPRANKLKLFHNDTPDAVIYWGQFKDDEVIKRIKDLHLLKRPKRVAWIIDTREDSIDPGANKCFNADLLERNHKMLYPYYTLDRVVGIDAGPQKSEQLTLVAFYERYDGEIELKSAQTTSKGTKEGGPKAEAKVPNQQVPSGLNAKRKAPDQHRPRGLDSKEKAPDQRVPGGRSEQRRGGAQKGKDKGGSNRPQEPIGSKRPRREGSPQQLKRDSSRRMPYQRARDPDSSRCMPLMGSRERPQNPWFNNSSFDRPPIDPRNQTGPGILSQLDNVIGKQLLLAQMNSALQLTSSSMMDMGLNRGAAGDHDGHGGSCWGNNDFPPAPRQLPTGLPRARSPPCTQEDYMSGVQEDARTWANNDFPPAPRQLPTVLPRARSPPCTQEDYRSGVQEDARTWANVRSTSREGNIRDNFRRPARQEFTSDDFWNTPLTDLARNEFRSAIPTQEHITSSSASREAVRGSISGDEFPQENYKSSSRDDSNQSYFRRAEHEEFRSASPTRQRGAVRSLSPHNEDHTHHNFSRGTRDVVHVDRISGTREDIIRENFGSMQRENSTRDDTRRRARDEFTDGEFRSAAWEDSGIIAQDGFTSGFNSSREDYRSAPKKDISHDRFRSSEREESTHDNSRRAGQDFSRREAVGNTRSAAQGLITRHDRSTSKEDLARHNSRTAHGDSTESAFRYTRREDSGSATHENFRSAAREDFPRNRAPRDEFSRAEKGEFRSTAREDFPQSDARRAPREEFSTAGRDDFRSTAKEDFPQSDARMAPRAESSWAEKGEFRNAAREDFPQSDARRAPREEFSTAGRDDFRSTAREDFPQSDARRAPRAESSWAEKGEFRNAAREDFPQNDDWRAPQDDFNRTDRDDFRSAAREDFLQSDARMAPRDEFSTAVRDDFRSAAREDFPNLELGDISQENLTRDEFFGFVSGPRDSFDYTGSSRLVDENASFRSDNYNDGKFSRDIRYNNGRVSGDRNAWDSDITRRNY